MAEKGKITVDEAFIYYVDSDPTAGGGFAAALGSLLMRNNGSTYIKTAAGDTAWTAISTAAAASQVLDGLFINGLVASYNTTTTFDVTAGTCRDSTDTYDMTLGAPVTVDTSLVDTINGRDNTSFGAEDAFYIYLIGDSTLVEPTGVIISTRDPVLTPNLGGIGGGTYDHFRWIGCISTQGTAVINRFIQDGAGNSRKFFLNDHQVFVNSGSTAFITASLTRQPYVANQTMALVNLYSRQLSGTAPGGTRISKVTHDISNFQSGTLVSRFLRNSGSTTGSGGATSFIPTTSTPQVFYQTDNTDNQVFLIHQGYSLEV